MQRLLLALLLCPLTVAAQSTLNDLDGDGCVGATDILVILGQYGECVDTIAPILNFDIYYQLNCTEWLCDADQLIQLGVLEVVESSSYTIDLECSAISGGCVTPFGGFQVTIQATDESGNVSPFGLFYVILTDNVDPVLDVTCPPAAEAYYDESGCDYDLHPTSLGMPVVEVTDCDENVNVQLTYFDTIVEATCGNGFVVDREWTIMAIDHCENFSTEICHQIITVIDTTAPSLGLSEPLMIPCSGGSVDSVLAAWFEANGLQGCSETSDIDHVWDYDSLLDCSDVDVSSSVLLTISDDCDNSSQYEAQLMSAQEFACGDSVLFDNYWYETVLIGDQCWFAENLRTTVYENGDTIPAALNTVDWLSINAGALAVYGEGSSLCVSFSPNLDACDEAQSLAAYGLLYNWYAVDDARGLCPAGWHVPTDGDWTGLVGYVASQGFQGTEGTALKSTTGWKQDSNGTDNFGFSAPPGGNRWDGNFTSYVAGDSAFWWSSSPSGGDAWARFFYWTNSAISRQSHPRHRGFSVRCLKDE